MYTIEEIDKSGWLIYKCIVGSKAYGLDTPSSDTDIKGVYILPKEQFYSLEYVGQVNNETNDIAYYELKKFIELLAKNNPNILEMLDVDPELVICKDPIFDKITSELFLSKLCKDTFAGYASTQIKKARGLSKKIFNPIEKVRKGVLDFCFVPFGQGSISITDWLAAEDLNESKCGLSSITHMKDFYNLYYDEIGSFGFNGIINSASSNDVVLSSIPKGLQPISHMYFNKSQYSIYCREYKEYWEWVEKRNDERYKNTISHGKNYDAKNIMHTFRLLSMVEEILSQGKIVVKRPNREELLKIKSGVYLFEDLIEKAEEKIKKIEELAENSSLPDHPDLKKIEKLLFETRNDWYLRQNIIL
jgi:uncharacterized protein YaaR (DUF327 family)